MNTMESMLNEALAASVAPTTQENHVLAQGEGEKAPLDEASDNAAPISGAAPGIKLFRVRGNGRKIYQGTSQQRAMELFAQESRAVRNQGNRHTVVIESRHSQEQEWKVFAKNDPFYTEGQYSSVPYTLR